jgi:hypothetical protein
MASYLTRPAKRNPRFLFLCRKCNFRLKCPIKMSNIILLVSRNMIIFQLIIPQVCVTAITSNSTIDLMVELGASIRYLIISHSLVARLYHNGANGILI